MSDINNLKKEVEGEELNRGERKIRQKSIKEIVSKYLVYYPLFILTLSLALFFTYLKIHFQIPLYITTTKIILKDAKSGGAEEKILADAFSAGKANLANELEILKSTNLMKRVVTKLKLNTVCIFQGKFRNTELYDPANSPILVINEISDSTKNYTLVLSTENKKIWCDYKGKKYILQNHVKSSLPSISITPNLDLSVKVTKLQKYFISWTPTNLMSATYSGGILASSLNKEATIILLSHTSESPLKSQDILNKLAEEYNNYNIEQKNKSLDNSIKFLAERLYYLSGDLGDIEDSLLQYKESHKIVDLEVQTKNSALKIDELKGKIDEIVVKMMVCDMVSQYVNNTQRKFNLIPSSLGIEDVTLNALIGDYNKDVLNYEELLKTLPKGNVQVITIETEIDQLRSKIIEAIKNVKKAYIETYNFNKKKQDNLLFEIGQVPIEQKSILQIERQQGIKGKLYLYLLEKFDETSLAKASAISNSTTIDSAVSSGPIGATKAVLYSMAVLLGLGIPVLLIFIRDLLNDKISTKEDVVQNSSIPVIGEISHYKQKNNVLIASNSRGLIAEQFRLLRTNLQYFSDDSSLEKGVILITSTMKGEGKTFISMNLGAVIALSGKKTILLEFDLRKPRVSKALGIENEAGISTFITSTVELTDLVKPVEGAENLWILPSGPVPPNPAELILNKKVKQLFDTLSKTFDYIIIDTPPIGIVSDARVLSKYSDINFYIIRQRYTLKNQMEFVDTLYTNKVIDNMALIVNDVVVDGVNSYYGYGKENYIYGGYYGYAYGYGYNDDFFVKKSIFNRLFSN